MNFIRHNTEEAGDCTRITATRDLASTSFTHFDPVDRLLPNLTIRSHLTLKMTNEEPKYVTFVSSDGFEFVVKRSAACVSDTVKRMLNSRSMSPPLVEGRRDAALTNRVNFSGVFGINHK